MVIFVCKIHSRYLSRFFYYLMTASLTLVLAACGGENDKKLNKNQKQLKESVVGGSAISNLRIDYFKLSNGVDISDKVNVEKEYFQIEKVDNTSGERCPEIEYNRHVIKLKDSQDNVNLYGDCAYRIDSINLMRNSRIEVNVITYNAYEHSIDGLTLAPISLVSIVGQPLDIVIRNYISSSLLPEDYELDTVFLIGQGELTINKENQSIVFNSNDIGPNRIVFEYKNNSGEEIKGSIDVTVQASKNNTAPKLSRSSHVVYLGEKATIDLSSYIEDDKKLSVNIFDVKGFETASIEYAGMSITVEYSNYGKYYLGVFVKDEDGIISSGIVAIEVMDRLSLVDVFPSGVTSSINQSVASSDYIITFF